MTARDEHLVSTDWLDAHRDDPDLRVFDVTTHLDPSAVRSGREDYAKAHVPGAGFLDIVDDLSDPSNSLAFTRPSAEQLEAVLSRAGVSNAHRVIFYSGTSPMWATRAWWLLRAAGHDAVALLDGGLAKWRAEERPLCEAPCGYPPAHFVAGSRPAHWADRADVLRAVEGGGACMLDALPRAIWTGEADLGYARPGHIRGSRNLPFHDLLDPDTGALLPDGELERRFREIGILERERVISYCGGAIAATLNGFALVLVGHPDVAVYDGGLDEWSRDPDLPMDVGSPD